MERRKTIALSVAVLFFSGFALAQIGFNQQEKMMIQRLKASDGKLEEGKALFTKGKFDKAEKKFKECLDIFPKNADANYFMAQILLKKNSLEQALESIKTAETCFSELGKLYSFTHQEMLNKLREQKQELEEGNLRLQEDLRALQSSPGSAQTQASISGAQAEIQQRNNLISQIDAQLRKPVPMIMEKPAGYFYIHGNILFKLKDYQGAVDQYLETIKRDPKHEFAYNNLANIFFMAKQYDKALGFLEQAEAHGVKINPQFKKDIEDRLAKKQEALSSLPQVRSYFLIVLIIF
jgi:stress-induced-phosphoprotein 1